MSIIYKGKVYRNIQEQVKKNMEDIEELKNGGTIESKKCSKPYILTSASLTEEEVQDIVDNYAIVKGTNGEIYTRTVVSIIDNKYYINHIGNVYIVGASDGAVEIKKYQMIINYDSENSRYKVQYLNSSLITTYPKAVLDLLLANNAKTNNVNEFTEVNQFTGGIRIDFTKLINSTNMRSLNIYLDQALSRVKSCGIEYGAQTISRTAINLFALESAINPSEILIRVYSPGYTEEYEYQIYRLEEIIYPGAGTARTFRFGNIKKTPSYVYYQYFDVAVDYDPSYTGDYTVGNWGSKTIYQ